MKSTAISLLLLLALLPLAVSAHERRVVSINGVDYLFVVGSQNEPIVVDDKTGLDLFVKIADPKDIGNSSSPGAKPVEGLEKTLKVEIMADGKKKELTLRPAYKDPGHYNGLFFPTTAQQFSYRLSGTLNNTPIELLFTCMPGEHVMGGVDNTKEVVLGENVTQKLEAGMFSCPLTKTELGFPEPSSSVVDAEGEVHEHVDGLAQRIALMNKREIANSALALIALVMAMIAFKRAHKKDGGA